MLDKGSPPGHTASVSNFVFFFQMYFFLLSSPPPISVLVRDARRVDALHSVVLVLYHVSRGARQLGGPYPAFSPNVGLLMARLLSSSLSLCCFLLWKEKIYYCFHSYIWIKSFMSLFLRLCPKRKDIYNRKAFIYLSTPLSLVVKAPAAVKPSPHESLACPPGRNITKFIWMASLVGM